MDLFHIPDYKYQLDQFRETWDNEAWKKLFIGICELIYELPYADQKVALGAYLTRDPRYDNNFSGLG